MKQEPSQPRWRIPTKVFFILNLACLMIHMVMMNRYLMASPFTIFRKSGDANENAEPSTMQLQNEFQQLMHQHNTNPNNYRILFLDTSLQGFPGFCVEFRMIARYLQVAIASNRTLVIDSNYTSGYELPNCGGKWNCLFSYPTTMLEHTARMIAKLGRRRERRRHKKKYNASLTELLSKTEKNRRRRLSSPNDDSSNSSSILQDSYQSMGITHHDYSSYFDTLVYGIQPFVFVPYYPFDNHAHIDVIPFWERSMGRFWVRSQVSHYLWNYMTPDLQQERNSRMPKINSMEPYIGFHIRYSDNIRDLERDFGRSAFKTRHFSHFMEIAERIRSSSPNVKTIYLATDNQEMIAASHNYTDRWNFVLQDSNDVPRVAHTNTTFDEPEINVTKTKKGRKNHNDDDSYIMPLNPTNTTNSTEEEKKEEEEDVNDDLPKLEWFVKSHQQNVGAIVADLEMLRRANYLVGSFQSNVYRLAAELNSAYHPGKEKRIYAVDIEWYEDP